MKLKIQEIIYIIKYIPMLVLCNLYCFNELGKNKVMFSSYKLSQESIINFSIIETKTRLIFIVIVRIVTLFILVYRTFYIEFYNKKKFSALTIIFFLSIFILSLRRDLNSTLTR